MSAALDHTLRTLNDSSCCKGNGIATPLRIYNRPGLLALAYRIGTHAEFKKTLLARLSGSGQVALRGLNTREDDDFTIALLDAWSVVADILTFYQERIANESYLRTAAERLSVLELARLIGYELRPGVAASAYLAFTIEETPGAFGRALSTVTQGVSSTPPPVVVDIGIKVQSIPGPGEKPQTFETVEKIEARAEWNAMRPRLTQVPQLSAAMASITLRGTATNLKQGDVILIIDASGVGTPRTVLAVTPDDDAKTTRLDFSFPSPPASPYIRPSLPEGAVTDFPEKVELAETVILDITDKTWKEEDLAALASMQGWPVQSLIDAINLQVQSAAPSANASVFAFRQKASIFGHNAPKWESLPTDMRFTKRIEKYKSDGSLDEYELVDAAFQTPWEGRTLESDAEPSDTQRSVYLDAAYSAIIRGSWILLAAPSSQGLGTVMQPFKVKSTAETTRSDFAISAKVTKLKLEASSSFNGDFTMRTTTVLAQSESLELAEAPITDIVENDTITLDRLYFGLRVGRRVILSGERADLKGVIASEVRKLKEVVIEAGFTVVTFDKPLTYPYVRETVAINANVALATHGETVREVLGSGNAAQTFQSFTLRQPPLTHVGASTPSGAQTTLEVRVNDLLRREAPAFYTHMPEERIYVTRTGDDGVTTVMFGDGKTGARLPTGQENVKAKYRKGIGLAGLVKEHQLTQLMTRPIGLKGVTNPLPTSGAADPEQLNEARRNAPLTVLTLERIVSLQDYEDFARSFLGVDKAFASWTWNGERRTVVVTVAGSKGAEVLPDSELYKNLLDAMQKAGDPTVPLSIVSYRPRFFRLTTSVAVAPDYLSEKVLSSVEQTLRGIFSFDARNVGRLVSFSEVTAAIQSTPGVSAANIIELYRTGASPDKNTILDAEPARLEQGTLLGAELLMLDPRPLTLSLMQEVLS